MDKQTTIQILSVEIIRFFFIFAMILSVSLVSIHTGQRHVRVIKKTLGISASSISQPLADENAGGYSVYGVLFKHMNKNEQFFHPIIVQVSSRHQVDPALVKAIIMAESGYNPKAISKSGAKGLMQLMPDTATRFGVTDSFEPAQNIEGGVKYLNWLMGTFDRDPVLVLAGYNAGEGSVRKHQGVPPFAETRDYVPKVLATFQLARGLCITPPELVTDGCVFATMN